MTQQERQDEPTAADDESIDRRQFMASTAAAGSIPFLVNASGTPANAQRRTKTMDHPKSIIGGYGAWAAGLAKEPAQLSFRNERWKNIDSWRKAALEKATECIAAPEIGGVPVVTLNRKYEYDGLEIEELSWQLPYGRPTQAILLKPKSASGRLPAVLGLHDHGGKKYFGRRKITRTSNTMHPIMVTHQEQHYAGLPWANEIAKRGYVVLVHDTFSFASRRVLFEDMSEIPWGECSTRGKSDADPETPENIEIYNKWANGHEHIMAKSLFCGGTTWPGVFLAEDQRALDVLANREDVDAQRIGCAGLSGGGLRTTYLGGLDPRVKCAICVGFMSTWKDFLLNKSYTHTWMTYTPVLPKYLDFPEILGLRAPLPTMTLNNNSDDLYTLAGMQNSDSILKEVFAKADASDHYHGGFYPGEHKFDAQMQKDAFDWFDKWLKQ